MSDSNHILNDEYKQYNDFVFKNILKDRANGVLKFVKIPYRITDFMISEYTNLGPKISRMDFVGGAVHDGKSKTLILECQTHLPTKDDVRRFFQYVSALRLFKDRDVDLYILCYDEISDEKMEFQINENCIYTMHMISLKDFRATDIFKSIENKLKNNYEIADEDIASLQLIIYTDFSESELEILTKARLLLEKISERLTFDINEKSAILYIFEVLSVNMLNKDEQKEFEGVNKMLLSPRDRYLKEWGEEEGMKKGKKEAQNEGKLFVAGNMLKKGYSIDEIVKLTGLDKDVILASK